MSVVIVEDFEAGLAPTWTLNGVPTTGAAAAHTGAAGLIIDTTGGSATQYIQQAIAAGTRVFVSRFYFTIVTLPAATQHILTANNASGQARLTLLNTGALRASIGAGAVQNSAVLTVGQMYRVDLRINTSGATATMDWMIDGAAQTQATSVQAAADQNLLRLGIIGATTTKLYFDTLVTGNAVGDYPFGPNPVNVNVGVASAVAATFSVASGELAALAGIATATAAAYGPGAKLQVPVGVASATAAALSATSKIAASVAAATAVGAVPGAHPAIAAPAGVASGTAAANPAASVSTIGATSLQIFMG